MLITIFFCNILLYTMAQQEDITTVQGTVYGLETREALGNVTVRISNTNAAVTTNEIGHFAIAVRSLKDSLTITAVGYRDTTVSAGSFTTPAILYLVRQTTQLEEVVVQTGYQSLKVNEITGAVDVISNEMLNQQTGLNILQRLNNITPGIRFDNQAINTPDLQKLNVSIRGLSTINGHLDPLVVLDGFIYEGNINNIDPNSIENITILKDASASSIWGARAGNGVIVMTSKKGDFMSRQPTRVTVNNTWIIQKRPDLNSLYELSNRDFIEVEEMLFNQGYYNNQLNNSPFLAVTPAIDIFDRRKRGMISATDSASMIQNLLVQDGRRSYMSNFYDVPLSQQYNLNISGGSLDHSYGLGVGYTQNTTELSAGAKKANIQLNNSFRPIDKLQVDMSILFTSQKSNTGKPAYSSLAHNGKAVPYMQFIADDGAGIPFEREFRRLYLDERYTSGLLDWGYYPLTDYRYSRTITRLNEWYASTSARYKLLPFLDMNLGFQFQNQTSENTGIDKLESYAARSYINQFTEVDPTTGSVKYNVPLGGIRKMGTASSSSYTFRGQSNLNKNIGLLKIIGMLGAELRQNKNVGSSYTAYGFNDDPLMSAPVDFANRYRNIPTNSLRNIAGMPSFSHITNRFVSVYSNWSAIWDNRYGLSGSFRRDGGNIFGATTNDKWSPLWSIGGSWDLTNESFFRTEAIDRLRLRATYGYSGSVDLRKTPDPVAYTGTAQYTNLPMLAISVLNDPSLRWEKVGTFNLGLDFALARSRITGAVDYYVKNGRDLYGLTDYDYTTWGNQATITKNVAAMRGRGWDISINSLNTTGALKWNSRLIFSFNKNVTTAYYNSANSGVISFLGNGNTIQPFVGKPLNGIAAYRYFGLDEEGRALGILDGELTTDYLGIRRAVFASPEGHESIEFIGSSKPQQFGNLINTLDWKNFGLSINISYKGDYYFQRPVTSYAALFQSGTAYPDFESRWKAPGDEQITNVPAMTYPVVSNSAAFYSNADINVFKGNHLRLEYISGSWTNSWKIGNREAKVQIYGNVSNLGLLWTANRERIDPEFPYRLSPPISFSLGLKVDY
ncbi:SusC/RagA family TonB-linked outer membrane protein [Sphingobacterium alkalisoli]|nr:SusC/RagA family TonB-linked outer membrane protein [Sphingobacterium alkalisoli]